MFQIGAMVTNLSMKVILKYPLINLRKKKKNGGNYRYQFMKIINIKVVKLLWQTRNFKHPYTLTPGEVPYFG